MDMSCIGLFSNFIAIAIKFKNENYRLNDKFHIENVIKHLCVDC